MAIVVPDIPDGKVSVDVGSLVIGDVVVEAVSGTALAADQTNSELRTSVYGKSTTAGDTPLGVDAAGRVTSIIQAVGGTALAADQTNSELRTSVYGKSSTAGDTALGLDASGRVTSIIQAVGGTALVADQTNSELRVSNYVKTTTAGDTALTLGQTTMANSLPVALASDQSKVPTNLAQWNGSTVSSTNPLLTQDHIRTMILNGQGYTANAANTTGSTALVGLSIFNNSTAKNCLIYRIFYSCGVASSGTQVNLTTSDPALGTSVTPVNNSAGGAGSAIASKCSSTNTAVAAAGTLLQKINVFATETVEAIVSPDCILLPANAANGIEVLVNAATTSWAVNICWVEY